ncbi:MAG TPA: TraB/GumN family protein [Caulobacteraceae bacterium]|nr:TraB/GumN family protein [Caulobacteraceae bacterium]
MPRLKPLLLVLAALALCAAAPAPRDAEATLVEELVVNGPPTGPAYWTVSRGASSVYILGAPALVPKGLRWNTARTETYLKGARVLILPPKARANPLKLVAFFWSNGKAFRSARPMEETLPPALKTRFSAARTRLGKPESRYAKVKPGVAAVLLGGDFRGRSHLTFSEPIDRVKDLASRNGVRQTAASGYDVMPVLKGLTVMSDAAHQACLADALTEVEAGDGRIRTAAEGWAHGDVRAALTAERGFDRCLAMLPGMSALVDRGMADTANAISAALARPGKSVAVVPLRQLLAKGGVLDQLRARGYAIETPRM